VSSAEGPARRASVPAVAHGLLLAVLLALALALSERGTGFSVDEGSYAIQSEALAAGSWEIGWPFREVDPAGDHFPYHAGRVTEEAEHAYVAHPSWPAVLSVARQVGPEEVGLRLVPLVSVVVAALAAWGVARRLFGPEAAPWAFWAVAASPLLPNGLMLWAHAPAAALSGLAVLGAVAIVQGRSAPAWWPVLPLALAGLVLVRSEGLLFAAAAVVTAGLVGLVRRDGRTVALAVGAAAATGLALLAERAWVESIVGDGGHALSSRAGGDGWLAGRLEGAGVVLLEGGSSSAPAVCSLLGLLATAAAVVARRRRRDLVLPLLAAAAVLMLLRLLLGGDEPVAGLLTAWPAVALGVLAVVSDRRALALAGGVGAFVAAVLATQYDDGGGLQWGGRYLASAVVPLGALTGAAVARHLDGLERRAVGALLAVTAVSGLVVTDEVRQGNAAAVEALEAVGRPAGLVRGRQLARLDWRAWPERCWLADGSDVAGAVDALARARALPAAYLGLDPDDLEAVGAVVDRRQPGIGSVTIPGAEGRGRCP
jgi:hypothetical protein